ncbi:MAG: hypothetical protein MN733_19390 [Nitrososphaera sp.]|nr:hypothetical protein [Nitrososphaera sp.]
MAGEKARRLFGFAVFIAWASSIYFLFPLPPQEVASLVELDAEETTAFFERETKLTGLSTSELQGLVDLRNEREKQAIWLRWVATSFVVLAGLAGGVLAFKAVSGWDYVAVIASFLYLTGWLITLSGTQIPEHATIIDSYISRFSNALIANPPLSIIVFFHKDLLMPFFHFVVVTSFVYRRPIPV